MSEKCALCNKTVYWNERTRAVNKTWHKTCFRCAGCNKALALGSQLEHSGNPFCNTCYQRNYGARGFRGGSSGSMVYGNFDGSTPVIMPSEQWRSSRSLKITDLKNQQSLMSKDSIMVELAPPAEAELQEAEEQKRLKQRTEKDDGADESDDHILALEKERGIDEDAKHEVEDDEDRESEGANDNHGTSEDSTESLVRVPVHGDAVSEDEERELPHHKSLDETDVRQRLASIHGSAYNKSVEVVLAAAEENDEDVNADDHKEKTDEHEDKEDKESQPKQEGYWDMLEQNQSYRYLRDTVTSWFGGKK